MGGKGPEKKEKEGRRAARIVNDLSPSLSFRLVEKERKKKKKSLARRMFFCF